jgi:hypothetical protein
MTKKKVAFSPEVGIWQRIELEGILSPAAARALLKVRFSDTDVERMHALSAKARAGTLTPTDEAEMNGYERLGCLLDILHSKARRALKKQREDGVLIAWTKRFQLWCGVERAAVANIAGCRSGSPPSHLKSTTSSLRSTAA